MRTGLPNPFIAELSRPGRKPRQLLEFYFASGTVYVSDQEYSELANMYLPLVENWGELGGGSQVEDIIRGTASGTRQMTISLLNTGEAPFAARFNDEPPENVEVALYQWFEGTAEENKVLVDRFVIQDPIEYNEASMLLRLDLVSLNMLADPYIGQLDPNSHEFYGITIGEVGNAPGTPYGTRPIVYLDGDLTATAVTIPCTSSPATAGFPASGSIMLDFEKITYTGISGNNFTGCTRGVSAGATYSAAMPHDDGQAIFEFGREYLYSFGIGPLAAMGPVYVNGEIYAGQHTIYKDRNPVQVGFLNGDPFIAAAGSTVVTETKTNFTTLNYLSNAIFASWNAWASTKLLADDSNKMTLSINIGSGQYAPVGHVSIIRADMQTTWGDSVANHAELVSAKIKTQVEGPNHAYYDFVVKGYVVSTGQQIASQQWAPAVSTTYNKESDMSSAGWSGVTGKFRVEFYIMYNQGIFGPFSTTAGHIDWVYTEIKYKPYIKNYSTDITCDLSSGTGNTNPADAVRTVLSIIGIAAAIDTASFSEARQWYDNNGYYFNGFIPGDYRCRQTLSAILQQSRSRLTYNGGTIRLTVLQPIADRSIAREYSEGDRQARSIKVTRQSVGDIINKLTLRYAATGVQADYTATVETEDADSLSKYGLHESVLDFFLVGDQTMAEDLAAFYLGEWAVPYMFLSFTVYLEAFDLEPDDVLVVHTDFSALTAVLGDIATISRQFASGKNNQINTHNITVKAIYAPVVTLDLEDEVTVTEELMLAIDPDGYGSGGYGEGGYGN